MLLPIIRFLLLLFFGVFFILGFSSLLVLPIVHDLRRNQEVEERTHDITGQNYGIGQVSDGSENSRQRPSKVAPIGDEAQLSRVLGLEVQIDLREL